MSQDEMRTWRTQTTPGGGWIPWRPGYWLPRRWTTRLDGDHLRYKVELDFETGDNGPQCRSVRLTARDDEAAISARDIRSVPIAACIDQAVSSAAQRGEETAGQIRISLGGSDLNEVLTHNRPRQDRRTTDRHLREVAAVYRAATTKPTKAVEDHWSPVSYSTAARWVMQARRRGFLPPTKSGVGGTPRPEDPNPRKPARGTSPITKSKPGGRRDKRERTVEKLETKEH
jgi:hypothetical protein